MKTGLVVAMLVGVVFLAGCSQEVQTGRIVTCKHCGKEIQNSVRSSRCRHGRPINTE